MATRRREAMIMLADVLGVQVQAGETTGELIGRMLERARALVSLSSSSARAEASAAARLGSPGAKAPKGSKRRNKGSSQAGASA